MAKRKTTTIAADYDYDTVKIRDKSGKLRTSRGNQDAVAKALLIYVAGGGTAAQVAKANGLKMTAGDRNEGLFRMAVGNSLRAKVRAGESVKIGSIVVKSLKQKIAMPKDGAPSPRPKRRRSAASEAASVQAEAA